MRRNAPPHFNQKGKCETHEELKLQSFPNNLCGRGVPAHMLASHTLIFQEGEPCQGAEFNAMSCCCWFNFVPGLIKTPLGQVEATPLVNPLNAAAFFQACSRKKNISHTCYKGLTEIHSSAHTLFPVVFGLGRPLPTPAYMPASRLCLIREGDVHNLFYMYCLNI